jgi:hypothetical protein
MAVTKHKKTQARVGQSTSKNPVSKKGSPVKATVLKKSVKKVEPLRKISAPLKKKTPVVAARRHVQKTTSASVERPAPTPIPKRVIPVPAKPTALICPLVLDGIVLADEFSPRDCFSCDEFDCRFYATEERSGALGSRLFVSEEADDEDLEDADLLGFDRGEDEGDGEDETP